GRDELIGLLRSSQRPLARYRDEGVQRGIEALDAREEMPRELDAGKMPRAQTLVELRERQTMQFSHEIGTRVSFDDFGHEVQSSFDTRRVALILLVLIGIDHFVRTQALHLLGERVRHRLDGSRVGGVELFDEAQDLRQAVDVYRQLLLADRKTGEVCDVLDIVAGETHGRPILDNKIRRRKQWKNPEKTTANHTPFTCAKRDPLLEYRN